MNQPKANKTIIMNQTIVHSFTHDIAQILGMLNTVAIPKAPVHEKGFINLRGAPYFWSMYNSL